MRTKLDELKVSQRRVEELAAYHGGEHGKDLTRELQSFLFDKVVSLGEELIGEPL